jgi:hypothetical protein
MTNSIDFRADQVRLNSLISSGSTPILIYPSSSATDLAGGLVSNLTSSVGSDVFLFVSGATDGTGKALFGGDLHISGNLTIDGTYPSGGGSSFFTELALDSIATTGSVAMTFLSASAGAEITGSLTQGSNNSATGLYSHAEGDNAAANAIASHAEGAYTVTNGAYSHAEGSGASTYGDYSHAEGFAAVTYGDYSHAEGQFTVTYGSGSHAEGFFTTAHGESSHAQGYGSEAFGTGSFAAGLYTVASGAVDGTNPPTTTQAAFGKFNLRDNVDSLFVIGDGLDDSNRNDVLRVNSGSVQVTGSFVAPNITGSLSGTVDGNPFIVGGSGITTNYNSSGQWEITGSGGGAAKSTNESLIDFFIAQNEASGYSSVAGNYSIGIRFYAATGSVSNGFRFFWSGSSPIDFEAKLWSGSVAIASSSFALTGANDYYGTWSGGPVNLSRYVNYGLTYRDTSGATYHYMNGCSSLFQFLIPNSNVSPLRIGQNGVFILWTPYSYAIGDAAPNTYPTINTSTIAFIEPLVSF